MVAITKDTFVLYNEQYTAGSVEAIEQNINAFNAASANAITLGSQLLIGEFRHGRTYDILGAGAIVRRDPSSLAAATPVDLTQDEIISVILNRTIGPVEKTLDAWRKIALTPEALSFMIGRDAGNRKAQEMLNTIIRCLDAAIYVGGASVRYDPTSAGNTGDTHTMISTHLVKGLAKFSDAASRIVAWVMHGKPFWDLVQSQVTDKITGVANVVIYGGTPATMGKPVIVTDSDALKTSASGQSDVYHTLGLTVGAGEVLENSVGDTYMGVVPLLKNLVGVFQSEYTFSVGVKGAKWDVTNGGANPTDAALATGSNWDNVVASIKDGPGVVIVTN